MNEVNDVIVDLITRLGFPIFVAVYFMMKNNKTNAALEKAINELITLIKGEFRK